MLSLRKLKKSRILTIRKNLSYFSSSSDILVGDSFSGFTVEQKKEFAEFDITLLKLRSRTGAKYFHFSSKDANNVFGVGFKTPPENDRGVPHILEHCVLCGSEKYPVNDPFMLMVRRSLNSYMNAMTSHDWTFYPFRSSNLVDLTNLQGIYLDAVFFPKLLEGDYLREGCHYFLGKDNASKSIGGVVFNEMKGVYSDPESILETTLEKHLFPDSAYRYDSGGEPLSIAEMTFKNLKDFHQKYYSPQNANFYSYGDFSLRKHAEFIEKNALSRFPDAKELMVHIEPQKKFEKGKFVRIRVQPDPVVQNPKKPHKVAISYLCCNITDTQEIFNLEILMTLLLEGQDSIFFKELIAKRVGSDFTSNSGVNGRRKQSVFTVGLNSVSARDAEDFKNIVETILIKAADSDFRGKKLESILNRIELGAKKRGVDFGLNLGIGVQACNVFGIEAEKLLDYKEKVEYVRKASKKKDFFKNLIAKYLLKNKHSVVVMTEPDKNYTSAYSSKEQEIAGRVSLERIAHEKKVLAESSKLKASPDILPTLSVKTDIATESEKVHVDVSDVPRSQIRAGNAAKLYKSVQPTNGICYLKVSFDIKKCVPKKLRPYLPFLAFCIDEFGARDLSADEFSQHVKILTGGINVSVNVKQDVHSKEKHSEHFVISSHCLEKNAAKMVEIFEMLVSSVKFEDREKLEANLKQYHSMLNDSLMTDGIEYASSLANSKQSAYGASNEMYNGVTHTRFVDSLCQKNDLDGILSNFQKIASHIKSHGAEKFFVSGSKDCIDSVKAILASGPRDFSFKTGDGFSAERGKEAEMSSEDEKFFPAKIPQKYFVPLPIQCNYVYASIPTVPYSHPDSAVLVVSASLMRWSFLHREIREKGNAYGSGANQGSGAFHMYSYRDPHKEETLEKMATAIIWISQGTVGKRSEFETALDRIAGRIKNRDIAKKFAEIRQKALKQKPFGEKEVEEAILFTFSSLDKPVSSYNKGLSLFSNGLTNEIRQKTRDRLLAVDRESVVRVCGKYILPHVASILGDEGRVVVEGEEAYGRAASFAVVGKEK